MKPTSTLLFVAAFALFVPAAHAAGPYDGNWYVDAQQAGTQSPEAVPQSAGCSAVRLPFKVTDNQISGSLQRAPYGTGRVEAGSGSSASPITGTVQADGSFTAKWSTYTGTGKLTKNTAELNWVGECGPRHATGGRLKQEE